MCLYNLQADSFTLVPGETFKSMYIVRQWFMLGLIAYQGYQTFLSEFS